MKFNFDFSELKKFSVGLGGYPKTTTLMTIAQNIARVLHENLLETTPVVTGNLRKMWSAGDNLLFTVERIGNFFEVVLINEARADSKDGYMYGVAVNDGLPSRNIIGRFFVENAMDLTIPRIEEIVMRELRRWLRST